MPKRINNIFDSKVTFENMLAAYYRAAKSKKNKKEVILFDMSLCENILDILNDIKNSTYNIGNYRKFIVKEPKERIILALPFRDRVVQQWYVEELVKPIFVPKFTKDSYACLSGKGTHKAVIAIQKYMRQKEKEKSGFWVLKCDISKFFYSISKSILHRIISRYIKDARFLEFTKNIIHSCSNEDNQIAIGNYSSQIFANIYLNELDKYIKESLNVKHYVRYMDDFILLLNSKEQCIEIKKHIEVFLHRKLKLKFNPKTSYFKYTQGVNFCGYLIYTTHKKIRQNSKKKMYRRIKKMNILYDKKELNLKRAAMTFNSFKGHASHADSNMLIQKIVKKSKFIKE